MNKRSIGEVVLRLHQTSIIYSYRIPAINRSQFLDGSEKKANIVELYFACIMNKTLALHK